MCAERRFKVSCHEWIAAVEVLNAEHLLDSRDALLCWRYSLLLLIEEVVTSTLCASVARAQAWNEL